MRFVLLILFAACGDRTPARSAEPAPAESAESQASSQPETVATPTPEPEPEALPDVMLSMNGLALEVRIHGDSPVRLNPTPALQHRVGSSWETVSAGYHLRASCGEAIADPCLELAPGAELLPPSWTGMLGDGQCDCTRCGPAAAGDYRFVVSRCAEENVASAEVIGPSFEWSGQ